MTNRVFALCKADEKTVTSYGAGTLLGNLPCPMLGGAENPCIKLDEGGYIWGCQCWWGPWEKYDEVVHGREIVFINVSKEDLCIPESESEDSDE